MQCYSSVEIKIDNPVLFEILKKYRDKGAFICDNSNGGFIDRGFGIGSCEREQKNPDGDGTPVAFYYFDPENAGVNTAPEKVEDVVDLVLDIILSWWFERRLQNRGLFEECKKELHERADEINASYIEVFWEAYDDSQDDSEYEDESWEDEDEEDDDGYDDSDSEEEEGPDWAFYYKK